MAVHFPPPQASSASHPSALTSTGHTAQPSVAVLQQTCAYTPTPFQALTSSTIPSSHHGEETLDRGNSSHGRVQIDEVFTRLPASPLTLAHHSLGPHLNGPENRHHPWRLAITAELWIPYLPATRAQSAPPEPIGKAFPVYYEQASALFF